MDQADIEIERGFIERQIDDWIRREVVFPEHEQLHGKCYKLLLRHLNVDGKPDGDIKSFVFQADPGTEEENIGLFMHQIADAAQDDADNIAQGVQSYGIFAFFSKDKMYMPRKSFRVVPSDVEMQRGGGISPTEPPTEKGLVSQTMRHLEAVMKTASVSQAYQMQSMEREMKRLSEANEKYASQQVDFIVLLQDTLDRSHRRRLDEKKDEADMAVKESIVAKVEQLVPVIINRIAGKPVLPEEDKSFMLMSSLLENLSEEQQMAFFNSLNDVQRITLGEILGEYEKKKSKILRPIPAQLGTQNKLPASRAIVGKTKPKSPRLDQNSAPPADETDDATRVADSRVADSRVADSRVADSQVAESLPSMISLRDRINRIATTDVTDDPTLQKYEDDAKKFMDRFRDFLGPGQKNPPK